MCSFGSFLMFKPSSFFSFIEMVALEFEFSLAFVLSFFGFRSAPDLLLYISRGGSTWLL